MKLHLVVNDLQTGWTHCRRSENGMVRLGVYRVLFGYRVRAGFSEDDWGSTLDWCAGDVWNDVERLYSLLLAILEQRDETPDVFDGIPRNSTVKPFYKDFAFVSRVAELAGDRLDLVTLDRPPHWWLSALEPQL